MGASNLCQKKKERERASMLCVLSTSQVNRINLEERL